MNYRISDIHEINKEFVLQARSGFKLDFDVHDVCRC